MTAPALIDRVLAQLLAGPQTVPELLAALQVSPGDLHRCLSRHDDLLTRVPGNSCWKRALSDAGRARAERDAKATARAVPAGVLRKTPVQPVKPVKPTGVKRVPVAPVDVVEVVGPPVTVVATILPGEVTAAVELLTSGHAIAMLAKSQGNRMLRRKHVAQLAAQMRRGEWMVGQPILFADTGRLLDGHHRLCALREAGRDVPFLVVRGIPEAAWSVLDTGVTRRVHDRLAVVGEGHSRINRRAIEIATCRNTLQDLRRQPTIAEIQAVWDDIGPAIRAVINLVAVPIRGISRAPVLLACAEYFHRAPDAATQFIQALHRDQPQSVRVAELQTWLQNHAVACYVNGSGRAAQIIYLTAVQAMGLFDAAFAGHPDSHAARAAVAAWKQDVERLYAR